jgi:pilus assembly protein CpaC
VRSGETIVLSGLLQRTTSNDIDKVPVLGDLPVLGALFRSKRFQNRETELVVFVTPTIVDTRAPGLVERVERTKERLGEHMGPTPFLSDPLQPQTDAGEVFTPASAPAVGPTINNPAR